MKSAKELLAIANQNRDDLKQETSKSRSGWDAEMQCRALDTAFLGEIGVALIHVIDRLERIEVALNRRLIFERGAHENRDHEK